ncbi:PREDICTED: protein SSUH2 homolog [Nanorana parkeri]|uniref:protein SSUH2 homolog n=1 Tax=Nanorana parkeri TaxID=125878 RepID=UPI00085418FF|nr:PREDICTED: protein SSUH2 homolog [Nanorana parkeri]
MEAPNSGMMMQPVHPGYPMNPVGANPMMLQGPNYPPAMNPVMAPGFYPLVNTNALAPQAAPYPQFTNIPGYEGMSDDGSGKFLPPPPVVGPGPDALPTPSNKDWTIPSITQEMAKQALLDYVSGQCCYGSSPVEEMEIQQMKPFNTYRYRLETFTESRSCEWVTKPLTNDKLDGPSNGPAPQPWDIILEPPALFHEETKKQSIPHTSSKKECEECHGKGKIICQKCNGNGRVKCETCNGTGRSAGEECSNCMGTMSQGCKTCNQTNVQTCPGCAGKGQVVSYIEMTVAWKNNLYEFIPAQNSEFPTDLFKKVPPLVNFPDASINQASQTAVQQHYSQFISSCRILKQRQTIEWLPLTKVEYNWKGKSCKYFVYGRENKVETKDYPSTCCCVIL